MASAGPHAKYLRLAPSVPLTLTLKQIRSSLEDSTAGSVASSLLSSRLDYVISILYGTSLKNINRLLQRIQHSLVRVVTCNPSAFTCFTFCYCTPQTASLVSGAMAHTV